MTWHHVTEIRRYIFPFGVRSTRLGGGDVQTGIDGILTMKCDIGEMRRTRFVVFFEGSSTVKSV
jgi:hypothetical protein